MKNSNLILSYTIVVLSCLLYYYVGYELQRTSFITLIFIWVSLFGGSYFLIEKSNFSNTQLIFFAVAFRVILLLVIPNLSQDFYRFIWDGRMLFEGFNPYLSKPETFITDGIAPVNQAKELYNGMGKLNASHYTNYPPFSQFCYWIAALFAKKSILGSVVVMRLQIILADIGILFIGSKLLQLLNFPVKKIFYYLLNPFIILELTGNLHFEAVMALFLILSLYLLFKNQWILAAIALGISVSVKLIPLLFLPIFLYYFWRRPKNKLTTNGFLQFIGFCSIVILTNIILFAPFLSKQFISNFAETIGLWFQNFEFNASIYYIIRWIGFQVKGWNIIGTVGKILPIIVIIITAIISLFRKNDQPKILLESLLFTICSYLLLSTTVHPWYLTIPLLISIFTNYKFLWVWTITIILSYYAYAQTDFKENLWLVGLEYVVVVGFFVWEVLLRDQSRVQSIKS